jgi:Flp pilus assembly protein TadG
MAPIRPSNRARGERGAALVEFAFALPLLLVVLAGIVDFGFVFQRYEVITNAAREGARLASLPGYDSSAAVDARVRNYVAAGLNISPVSLLTTSIMPTVTPVDSTVTIAGNSVSLVTVTVTYNHPYLLLGPVLGLINKTWANQITLTATSQMRKES